MNVSTKMARAFNKAVTLNENLNEDGTINWNFVDADVDSEMAASHKGVMSNENTNAHYDAFHFLADEFIAANPDLVADIPTGS